MIKNKICARKLKEVVQLGEEIVKLISTFKYIRCFVVVVLVKKIAV